MPMSRTVHSLSSTMKQPKSLSSLARAYYATGVSGRAVSLRQSQRLFRRDMEFKSRHFGALMTMLRSRGWHPHGALTPAMREIIAKRLGEP